MDYKNFKIDSSDLNRLAPILLQELELGAFQSLNLKETDEVTVVTKNLSGIEIKKITTIENAKKALSNPKLNDIAISSTEMRFEFEMNGLPKQKETTK